MPRVKISEYKAKQFIIPFFGDNYEGFRLTGNGNKDIPFKLSARDKYILKVDEGVKKRQKNGLIIKDIKAKDVNKYVKEFKRKGFSNFLLERIIEHDPAEEKFIALDRQREGIVIYYSNKGGVDIESAKDLIKKEVFDHKTYGKISAELKMDKNYLQKLVDIFNENHLVFLESNPFLVSNGKPLFLDLAVEVDSAAEFFVNNWSSADFVSSNKNKTPEESFIQKLNDESPASLKLDVLNPDGSIFTLFSGGGASLVLADEFVNLGKGRNIANYEYSGNPSEEETYLLTKNIIQLILKSGAKNKKLYIAGGVANFTDIRNTFMGIIKALSESQKELVKEGVKVYVRRGGPRQNEGLTLMKDFLADAKLLGYVAGPEMVLTDIVNA